MLLNMIHKAGHVKVIKTSNEIYILCEVEYLTTRTFYIDSHL